MRFWMGVASKDHVARGVSGGFCQLCHGKSQPLERMRQGDWIFTSQAVDIRPMISQLNFIQHKSRYAFRFGHIEISREVFELIAGPMLSDGQFSTHNKASISSLQLSLSQLSLV